MRKNEISALISFSLEADLVEHYGTFSVMRDFLYSYYLYASAFLKNAEALE